jgi:hypothetical protein
LKKAAHRELFKCTGFGAFRRFSCALLAQNII